MIVQINSALYLVKFKLYKRDIADPAPPLPKKSSSRKKAEPSNGLTVQHCPYSIISTAIGSKNDTNP